MNVWSADLQLLANLPRIDNIVAYFPCKFGTFMSISLFKLEFFKLACSTQSVSLY